MARLEVHKKDCIDRFGEPFTEVHKWLDELAAKYPITVFEDQHRKYRHNKEGIEEVRKMFGDKAAEAALLHLVRDEFGAITDKYFKLWEKYENEKVVNGKI